MEHQENQHQAGIEETPEGAVQAIPQVPPSLLAHVMSRIEQHHVYLGSLSSTELSDALSDARWEIRAAAVRALGQMGQLNPLLAAFQDEHRLVRATAVSALASLGTHALLDRLVLALQDPAWEVREMAVIALGTTGWRDQQASHALLQRSLQDASERVRDAAQVSLRTLEMPLAPSRPRLVPGRSMLRHFWLVLLKQAQVMHRSIWTVTALVLLLGGGLALINRYVYPLYDTALSSAFLTFLILAASATGAACIYVQEYDQGMEALLALPTSLRVVLLFRLFLVLTYNILLGFGISCLVALASGEPVWQVIQIWLVPLLCLSSLSMSFSLLVGSVLATQMALFLEAFQAIVIFLERVLRFLPGTSVSTLQPVLNLADWSRFYTNPMALPVAALWVALAIYFAPRQPRLRIHI